MGESQKNASKAKASRELNAYKRIIRSAEARRRILSALTFVPDKLMLKLQYRIKLGRKLNIENPKRFTEIIQRYKVEHRDPIMHQCVDKYEVRKFITACGLQRTLVELYGVYDNVEDIDFESLPDSFVAKKTDGSGGLNVLIFRSKEDVTEDSLEVMRGWLKADIGKSSGREWAYDGIKPRIVIERYLENRENPEAGIADYKFFASKGTVVGLVVDVDRYIDHKRNFYDAEWNYLDVSSDKPSLGDVIEKPKEFEEMRAVAAILSERFPFVRVDLYLVDHKVYFGELTFYPWSGYVQFDPDEYDYKLGSEILQLGWPLT